MLASGVGNVVVKFGSSGDERGGSEDGGGVENSTSDQQTNGGEWNSKSVAVDREEGAMRKVGGLLLLFFLESLS